MFLSCPLCDSWFNPSPLFNHEVHQRHETKPRNRVPIRGPRPGGPSDGSPARQRWVPSPHENQPQRGDRSPFLRDRQQSLAASNVFAERQTHALFPFASSRLRVRASGLNLTSVAAKITESRKRTLFPSDEAAEPTHPRRTLSPTGNPSPHASLSGSASASVSKTHGEEPGSIPIHLGTFGPSQAVAPGPKGRQTVAQRVSAGFRPPMKTSPAGATDSPLLHTPDSHSPLGRIPHARFAQAAKTPRQAWNEIRSSSHLLCVSASLRESFFGIPLRVFASSRETLSPQSPEHGCKNHGPSQRDTVPIRGNRLPQTLVRTPPHDPHGMPLPSPQIASSQNPNRRDD
jgi:hypothetical protein